MKKLSASVYFCATFHIAVCDPSQVLIGMAPESAQATNMSFLPPLICIWFW